MFKLPNPIFEPFHEIFEYVHVIFKAFDVILLLLPAHTSSFPGSNSNSYHKKNNKASWLFSQIQQGANRESVDTTGTERAHIARDTKGAQKV